MWLKPCKTICTRDVIPYHQSLSFGLSIVVFKIPSLSTISVLLCYEDNHLIIVFSFCGAGKRKVSSGSLYGEEIDVKWCINLGFLVS